MSFILSTITGILSGFGIGGGTLLIIFTTAFLGLSPMQARGVNLIYFIPTAASSLIGHIKNRLVDWRAFYLTAISGVASTLVASLFLHSLSEGAVKRLFGGFLILIGLYEVFGKRKS